MALNLTNITPSTNYNAGVSRLASVSGSDTNPIYLNDSVNYYYRSAFNLYTASSGGTNLGGVGNININLGPNQPGPGTYILTDQSITITVPSGVSGGTYWVGATDGSRVSITVVSAAISISFNINGGSGTTPTTLTGAPGSSFTMPTSSGFSRTGHSFLGWRTEPTGNPMYSGGSSYIFSIDTLLYAIWGINQYTITFNSNGGTSVSSITQNYGTTVTQPTNPSRTGYSFAGWYIDTGLTQSYTFSTMPANSFTLYAKWTAITYSITYVLDGGTNNPSNPSTYTSEVGVSLYNPSKTGYTFGGWYNNSGFTGSAITFIASGSSGNITLYAKWSIISYTISFVSNGGSAVSSITQNYDTTVNAPSNPTRTGYTFNGWYSDSGLTQIFSFPISMPAYSFTLYAKWTINQYTISFNSNGGTFVSSITQNFGTSVSQPSNPTRTGYTFNGWYSDSGLTNPYTFSTMPAYDFTLYAKWTINGYVLKFFNNDIEISSTIVSFGAQIVAPPGTPTKTDATNRYIFIGWNTNPSATTAMSLGTMPNSNISFYAIYNSYLSSFKINNQDVNLKVGSTQVKKIYKGATVIWEDFNV